MAITAARMTSDFSGFISPEMSAPIFDDARRRSVVQQLARRIPLGASGQTIPFTTSKPVANWVAEGGAKPASEGGRDLVTMTPQKLAAIVVNSAEVVRADPAGYISSMREDLSEAFAIAFDLAALYDLGGDGSGSGPFDDAIDDTTKSVEIGTTAQGDGGIHGDFVEGLRMLVADGKKLTGFALADVLEPEFWGAVDSTGRPLYVDLSTDDTSGTIARPGRLLARPSYMGDGVSSGDVVAFGGDWSKAAWGVVGGITYDVSDEATVTINGNLVSLWENNLVAIRAEAEYGFVVADVESFVKYTNAIS